MRVPCLLLLAASLAACATPGRPAAGGETFSNSDALGRIEKTPALGTVAGGSETQPPPGTGTAAPAPAATPDSSAPKPVVGPNGSELVPAAKIDALRVAGTSYCPLERFGAYYLRWQRGTIVLAGAERPFSPTEASMLEGAVSQLNSAIGRSVFSYGGFTSGTIPVTSKAIELPGVLGLALFRDILPTPDTVYEDARIELDPQKLQDYTDVPDQYPDLFRTVAMHELGHVAGLDHNPEPETLMNATTEATPKSVGFSKSEIDALRLLYASAG